MFFYYQQKFYKTKCFYARFFSYSFLYSLKGSPKNYFWANP